MANWNMTQFDAALKETYENVSKVNDLTYQNRPIWAKIRKDPKWGGDTHVLRPQKFGLALGRNPTFSGAKNLVGTTALKKFTLTTTKNYVYVEIDRETVLASEGDGGAFVELTRFAIEDGLDTLVNDLNLDLWGNGGGAKGRVSSDTTLSSTTLKLADPNDIVGFEVGQAICLASTDGTSGSLRDSGDDIIISSIDRDAGTMVLAEAVDSISGAAAGDYIFLKGDFGAKFKGFNAWNPATAGALTTLFGVDQTLDASRLGGVRYDGTGKNIRTAMTKFLARCQRNGSQADMIGMNPLKWAEMSINLESNRIVDEKVGNVSFQSIVMASPSGMVKIYGDPACPSTIVRALESKNWVFKSRRQAPHLVNDDIGSKGILRLAADDGFELRGAVYGQLGCTNPGGQGVMTVDAPAA